MVSYKQKYVHKVLVNCLVKLAQEKSVVRWTDHSAMIKAVDWDLKNQTKLKKDKWIRRIYIISKARVNGFL